MTTDVPIQPGPQDTHPLGLSKKIHNNGPYTVCTPFFGHRASIFGTLEVRADGLWPEQKLASPGVGVPNNQRALI